VNRQEKNSTSQVKVEGFVSRVFNTYRRNGVKQEFFITRTFSSQKEAITFINQQYSQWDEVKLSVKTTASQPKSQVKACTRKRVQNAYRL